MFWFVNVLGQKYVEIRFVNMCECSWTAVHGFTICESFVQAIQFVNVVGKQCMELNVMGKTCVEMRFVNICECSGQEI